jgi:D-alanine-D-alanine ligase-like ATP-grasp enzyme
MDTPKVDFNQDPLMCAQVYRFTNDTSTSYLIALAAWQRGLDVTFYSELASHSERFNYAVRNGQDGDYFSISSPDRTHYFVRSICDVVSREASLIAGHKENTKQILRKHNLSIPAGILLTQNTPLETVTTFLEQHPHKRFVIKPVDGTLGQGVIAHLTPQQVLEHIPKLPAGECL